MQEYVQKKMKTARVLRVITWLILPGIFAAVLAQAFLIPVCLLLEAMCVCAFFYIFIYRYVFRNVKWLESKGLSGVADDIMPDKPTFPASNICCGQNAMLVRLPFHIIPYAEIARIRRRRRETRRTILGVVVTETIEITLRDGKKYVVRMNSEDLKSLVEQYIRPNLSMPAAAADGVQTANAE